jgi:hypothetical protein
MVKAALEIVGYYQPTFWFMENPRRGLLPTRDFMKDIPFIDVDYCMFSDWGYQKPTRIWGSPAIKNVESRLCDGNCRNMVYPREEQGRGYTGYASDVHLNQEK